MRPGRRAALAALAIAPLALRAQAPPAKRVAVLGLGSEAEMREDWAQVFDALQRRGWKEGRNLEVIYAAGGNVTKENPAPWQRLPGLAGAIARRAPDAILAAGTQNARAAAAATRTVPIVALLPDPVASGFAASLARPGGNVTGLSSGLADYAVKSIEAMRLLLPKLTRVAVFHWAEASHREVAGIVSRVIRQAGLEPMEVPLSLPPTRILEALPGLRTRGVQGAYYSTGTWPTQFQALASAAIRERLPLWSANEPMTEAGLLGSMSSAENEEEMIAASVDRVLRGANPAELPIQYPQRFRLVINRKTASALGLKLPPDLLLRADRVIE